METLGVLCIILSSDVIPATTTDMRPFASSYPDYDIFVQTLITSNYDLCQLLLLSNVCVYPANCGFNQIRVIIKDSPDRSIYQSVDKVLLNYFTEIGLMNIS